MDKKINKRHRWEKLTREEAKPYGFNNIHRCTNCGVLKIESAHIYNYDESSHTGHYERKYMAHYKDGVKTVEQITYSNARSFTCAQDKYKSEEPWDVRKHLNGWR